MLGVPLGTLAAYVPLMLGALSASLLGSFHCASMCGPLVAFYSATDGRSCQRSVGCAKAPHALYHGARFLVYVSLGALSGALGAAVDWVGRGAGLSHAAAVVAAVLMVLGGLGVAFPAGLGARRSAKLLIGPLVQLKRKPQRVRATALGLISALLPCGFLYAFVVSAAGTGSSLGGALVMASFWLGTVPALLGTGALLARLSPRVARKMPLLTGAVLIAMGISGLLFRVGPLRSSALPATSSQQGASPPCH